MKYGDIMGFIDLLAGRRRWAPCRRGADRRERYGIFLTVACCDGRGVGLTGAPSVCSSDLETVDDMIATGLRQMGSC